MSGVIVVVVEAFFCWGNALPELAIACCPAIATAAVNMRAFNACLVSFIGLNSLLVCPTGEIEDVVAPKTVGVDQLTLASLACALDTLFIDLELKALAKSNNRGKPQSSAPRKY
jgi:hypothetical protein